MDICRVKNILDDLDTSRTESISLFFIEKRKNGYTNHVAIIEEDVREAIRDVYLEFLSKPSANLEQIAYNPNGVVDGKLEISDLETANMRNILEKIESEETKNYDFKQMDINKINFYCIKIKFEEEEFYFFRKFNKLKKLTHGVQGFLNGNGFVRVNQKIIGIDDQVDILIYNNEAAIFSRFALQTMFDLNDYFVQRTKIAMELIKNSNQIINFEQFETDCLSDKTAIKRLTKIVNTPNLITNFIDNISNLPKAITEADLSIELDAKGMIDYRGSREERNHILSCMADRYYISLLCGEVREDELR